MIELYLLIGLLQYVSFLIIDRKRFQELIDIARGEAQQDHIPTIFGIISVVVATIVVGIKHMLLWPYLIGRIIYNEMNKNDN